jgi:hypothetical protein
MTTPELDAALKGRIRPLKGRLDYGASYAERAVFDLKLGAEPFTAFFQMDRDTDRPTARCFDLDEKDTPRAAEVVWRLPTTTVRAVFVDFYTTSILFETANVDVDPLETYYAIRRINARFLPRRILVRESPAGLETSLPCPP